jgi:hypothetical protein
MKVKIFKSYISCEREDTDPKFYGIKNAAGESQFLYFLKKHLNKMIGAGEFRNEEFCLSVPFIKKRMCKDGNLVDEMQQYLRIKREVIIRTRDKKPCQGFLCLYNTHWAINGLEKDWNEGKANLAMEWI